MFNKSVNWYYSFFPGLRRFISRYWYEYLSSMSFETDVIFMNYGYVPLDSTEEPLQLSAEDEKNRYAIQMYHHLAQMADWQGAKALEIGSGRGGGAAFISRHFKPKSMIGVDITTSAVDFCQRHYSERGLSYQVGDAQALDFADNTFDIVLNVESSNCYPNIEQFFSEVVRVLRPNGHFLYVDLRKKEEMESWRQQLANIDLELIEEQEITPNVLKSLELDHRRKQQLIDKHVPRVLHRFSHEFAGTKGSHYVYGSLKKREKVYMRFVFRKPGV